MKVQKIVSLDVETAELASNMTNFSAFVRASLRAEAVGMDIASESARRAKWARAAHTLAEMCFGYAKALWEEDRVEATYENYEQLLYAVLEQTNLEDFE